MARAADAAYAAVRRQILEGRHPAGSWLREEEIAASTGVSRTPVREALQRLRAEGLVEILPNRGATVASEWSAEQLDEIYDMRSLLEGYAARRAAERFTADSVDVPALQELCRAMDVQLRRGGDESYNELTRLNLQFHSAVHQAAGNRQVMELLGTVIQRPLVVRTMQRYTDRERARSVGHHHELLEAILVQDGEWAESVMRSHVRAARASLRHSMIDGSAPAVGSLVQPVPGSPGTP
ncbi:MAG: GntR family transcriptional regulator [Mycobacteriales bacterium]